MERMSCKNCGSAMSRDDLDRRMAILSCHHCGAIYDLTRQVSRAELQAGTVIPDQPSRDRLERPPAAMPSSFAIERDSGSLKVSWRWFRPVHLFMLFFAIAWNMFLVGWYTIVLGENGPPGVFGLVFAIFPIVHVAAGLSIAYYAISGLLNQSMLTVSRQVLKVRHFPLPWYPMPTLKASEIEQLYCTRKVSQSKNGASVSFELRAVTRDNSGLLLVNRFDDLEQVLWLEQEIERTLGIRDRPVAGEALTEDG